MPKSFVLNLIINGIPSILKEVWETMKSTAAVLNLIINGIPSIQSDSEYVSNLIINGVLNLIINGIPSILSEGSTGDFKNCEVLNLIINGIPSIQ